MIRGGFGQRVAEERADRDGITTTLGDATLATNVLEETDHEHFEVDNWVDAGAAPPVCRIGGRAKRTSFPREIERIESLFEFGEKRAGGGPHQLGKRDEELRGGQKVRFEHDTIMSYITKRSIQIVYCCFLFQQAARCKLTMSAGTSTSET